MANPFTPQDAERLREARVSTDPNRCRYLEHQLEQAIAEVKGAHCIECADSNALTLYEARHWLRNLFLDSAKLNEVLSITPAMLDLIDALRSFVTAYDRYDTDLTADSSEVDQALQALRTGPHAEWLKQGR